MKSSETSAGQGLEELQAALGGFNLAKVGLGGMIPTCNGTGCLHLAFTIPAAEEAEWRSWPRQNGIAIESRVVWPRGGASLYFRDPDGHLLELVTPGCWAIY